MAANFGDLGEGIPLDLNPLVSLYGKNKRLSLRVERLPERARLSRGRNNGDRTWSLMREDLHDLRYLPPDSMKASHTLGIRILNLDTEDCATIAMLDFPVAPPKPVRQPAGVSETSPIELQEASLASRGDIELVNSLLAQRDSELAGARLEIEEARKRQTAQKAELNAARSVWEAELESQLAAQRVEARKELEVREGELQRQLSSLRAETQKEYELRVAELQARLVSQRGEARKQLDARETELLNGQNAQIEKARARWQADAEIALAKAKEAWKAEESTRLAQTEARWREHSAQAVAEISQRAKSAETALVRAEADTARLSSDSIELRRLRGELAEVNTALNARARELAEVRHALELARAEEFRGKAEFAAARSDWQKDMEQRVAQARAEAVEKTAALQTSNAGEASERVVAAKVEQVRLQYHRESAVALQQAKETWKVEEAARLARAEEQWRDKSGRALAESAARLERAEAALARAQAVELHESSDSIELRRMREEVGSMQAALGDREIRLAQVKQEMQRARERWKIESDNALRKAQEAWKAEEHYRVSVLRGDWQKDMRTTRIDSSTFEEEVNEKESAQPYGRLVRDGLLAAALAVAVVVLYPSITPFIEQWLPGGYFESSVNASQAAPQKPVHLAALAPAAPVEMMVSVNSANVRSDASSASDVVATVKRGSMVTPLERRGSWQHVRIGTGAQTQQGWVYAAFLTQQASDAH